jgi:hypothetical protein
MATTRKKLSTKDRQAVDGAAAGENLTARVTEQIRRSIVDAHFELGRPCLKARSQRNWASAARPCAKR